MHECENVRMKKSYNLFFIGFLNFKLFANYTRNGIDLDISFKLLLATKSLSR